ncbi:GDSL esterase/lipase At5g33370-like [Rutidosis leptorrhynchoides]|uniref:GDSL esterase/lipase At5g33370-like n=1 Tax=Rutidosis leptorrhynchoides TaxID=125765 RepID=UPI003A9A267E
MVRPRTASLWLIFGLCLTTVVSVTPPKKNQHSTNGSHSTPQRSSASPSPDRKQVRALFVFGDSLVDNGNNNYLYTIARADMPPYGIDSPEHRPTGRFSNGLNIPDIISEHIGSEPTLPYLSPELTGEKLLVGANFASAGVGILNDTGYQFVNVLRMPLQLQYFKQYQEKLSDEIGEEQAKKHVNQALVLISIGGNDFINNYFLNPFASRALQSTLPDYVTYLLSEYRKILEKLYDLGARRVLVMGSGPLGCAPAERMAHSENGDCAVELQIAAALYEPRLTRMLQQLNIQYGEVVFIAANTHLMHHDMISDPTSFGFISSTTACCGSGPFNGLSCTMASNLCENRDEYVFWDPFHPTERASRFIVEQMLHGTREYMKPMNLSVIMSLDSKM